MTCAARHFRSGRVAGIAPRHPPTPPDVRFSAFGGWIVRNASVSNPQSLDAGTLQRGERLPRVARCWPIRGGDRSGPVSSLRSFVFPADQDFDRFRSFLRPFADSHVRPGGSDDSRSQQRALPLLDMRLACEELVFRFPHDKDRARSAPDHMFRNAAEKHMFQTRASVRGDHD